MLTRITIGENFEFIGPIGAQETITHQKGRIDKTLNITLDSTIEKLSELELLIPFMKNSPEITVYAEENEEEVEKFKTNKYKELNNLYYDIGAGSITLTFSQ